MLVPEFETGERDSREPGVSWRLRAVGQEIFAGAEFFRWDELPPHAISQPTMSFQSLNTQITAIINIVSSSLFSPFDSLIQCAISTFQEEG